MLDHQDHYLVENLKAIDALGTTTKAYGKLHGFNVRSFMSGANRSRRDKRRSAW